MRKAFNQELLKIAEKDPRVFMILADTRMLFPEEKRSWKRRSAVQRTQPGTWKKVREAKRPPKRSSLAPGVN